MIISSGNSYYPNEDGHYPMVIRDSYDYSMNIRDGYDYLMDIREYLIVILK